MAIPSNHAKIENQYSCVQFSHLKSTFIHTAVKHLRNNNNCEKTEEKYASSRVHIISRKKAENYFYKKCQ